jgi:hypothetical protein
VSLVPILTSTLYCVILRVFLADNHERLLVLDIPLSYPTSFPSEQTLTLVPPSRLFSHLHSIYLANPTNPFRQQNAEKRGSTIGGHSKNNPKRKRRMNMSLADDLSRLSSFLRATPAFLLLPCCEYYISLCKCYLTSLCV